MFSFGQDPGGKKGLDLPEIWWKMKVFHFGPRSKIGVKNCFIENVIFLSALGNSLHFDR